MTEVTENTLPDTTTDLAKAGSEFLLAMDERFADPKYVAAMDATSVNLAHEAATAATGWGFASVAAPAQDMARTAGHEGYAEAFHDSAPAIIEGTVSTTTASASPQVDLIPLVALHLDGGTQSRVAIDEAVIAEYADILRAGQALPPVVAFFDGAEFWLVDGFHRYHAHALVDAFEIPGYIHIGTRRDAVLYSVGANAGHGLRRTNEDKRKAVKTLLADPEWVQWSDREIARQCAVHHETVASIRKAYLAESPDTTDSTAATRTVTRNGTTYEQKIKAKPAAPRMVADEDVEPKPEVATPRLPPEQGAVAGANVDALVAENQELREQLGELAEQLQDALAEAETMRKVIEANEPLAESVKSLGQAQELNRVLETRLQGLVNEKDEILRRYNGARHELDRLKQAHANLEALTTENTTLREKQAAALDEVASLKAELADALDSVEQFENLQDSAARLLADNEMMARVFEANDHVKAALAEVARYRAVTEESKRELAARANEYNERARLVSYWKKRAEKSEKQLAKTD